MNIKRNEKRGKSDIAKHMVSHYQLLGCIAAHMIFCCCSFQNRYSQEPELVPDLMLLLLLLFQGDTVTHCAQQSVHINMLRTKRALQNHNTSPHKWGLDVLTPSCGTDDASAFIQVENTLISLPNVVLWLTPKSDLQGLTLGGTICGCGSSLFLLMRSGGATEF